MNWSQARGIVRHLLTTAGGMLASKGYIETSEVEIIVGGLVAIIGAVWSVLAREKKA